MQEGIKWHLGAAMAENLVFKLMKSKASPQSDRQLVISFLLFSSLPKVKHRLVNYRATKTYFLSSTGSSFLRQ